MGRMVATGPVYTKFMAVKYDKTRSGRAQGYLKAQGYANVLNLTGGIDAWALQIDAEILWQIATKPCDRGVSQDIQGAEAQPSAGRCFRCGVGRRLSHGSPDLRR